MRRVAADLNLMQHVAGRERRSAVHERRIPPRFQDPKGFGHERVDVGKVMRSGPIHVEDVLLGRDLARLQKHLSREVEPDDPASVRG